MTTKALDGMTAGARLASLQPVLAMVLLLSVSHMRAQTQGSCQLFKLGATTTGSASPTLFIDISSNQAWQNLQAQAGINWINWDPFFFPLGQQAFNYWTQMKPKLLQAGYAGISFIVSRNGQVTTNPSCEYGVYAQQADSIVHSLKPPPFPKGSQLQSVAINYDFSQSITTPGADSISVWSQHHWGEFDGKLYRLSIAPTVLKAN
jgi:hypothetical protein